MKSYNYRVTETVWNEMTLLNTVDRYPGQSVVIDVSNWAMETKQAQLGVILHCSELFALNMGGKLELLTENYVEISSFVSAYLLE